MILPWSVQRCHYSVTPRPDYFGNIWPIITMKICPIAKIFAKVDSKFGQLLNKPSQNLRIQLHCWCRMNNSFTCLVKSKPVKQEDSHTVILPPSVSVLCLFYVTETWFRDGKISFSCLNMEKESNEVYLNDLFRRRRSGQKPDFICLSSGEAKSRNPRGRKR